MRYGYDSFDPRRYNSRGEFTFPIGMNLPTVISGSNIFTKTGTTIQPNGAGVFSGVATSDLPRVQFKASGDLATDEIWTVTGSRIQPI